MPPPAQQNVEKHTENQYVCRKHVEHLGKINIVVNKREKHEEHQHVQQNTLKHNKEFDISGQQTLNNLRKINIVGRNVDTTAPSGEGLKSFFWSQTAVIGPNYFVFTK